MLSPGKAVAAEDLLVLKELFQKLLLRAQQSGVKVSHSL